MDDISKWFWDSSVIKNGADTSEVAIEKGKPLTLGTFVKREKKASYYEELKKLEERVRGVPEAKK